MRLRSILLIFSLFIIVIALLASRQSFAAQEPSGVPAWLRAHVGEGDGQIAEVVLQRARALYQQKVSQGAVKNPCYFAMDATRPNDLGEGKLGRRFYVVCESERSFRAISAGHGGGRDLKGVADFANALKVARRGRDGTHRGANHRLRDEARYVLGAVPADCSFEVVGVNCSSARI